MGDKDSTIPQRNIHFEYGLVGAISQTTSRLGANIEFGHCHRESAFCPDIGTGLQVALGSAGAFIETEPKRRANTSTIVMAAPYLRFGILFNPGKSFAFGPIFRMGMGVNVATLTTAEGKRGPIHETTTANIDMFLQMGLRLLLPLNSDRTAVGFDLGAARYPEVPHSVGTFESPFVPYVQANGVHRF